MKFNVKTLSPVQIAEADFMQDMINGTSLDFSLRIDVPKDMMSGSFTAALEDGPSILPGRQDVLDTSRHFISCRKRTIASCLKKRYSRK